MRILLTLALLLGSAQAFAADAIYHYATPGGNYCAVVNNATDSATVDFTYISGRKYLVTDAVLSTNSGTNPGGLASGNFTGEVFPTTAALVNLATDNPDATIGVTKWNGTAVIDPLPNVAAGATGGAAIVGSLMGLADNAITEPKIAPDAFGASELAAAAVAEIQAGLALAADLSTVIGDIANAVNTLSSAMAEIESQTDDIGVAGAGLTAIVGGTTQPRFNKKPAPAFTVKVSRRADGTHKATSPIRITPGAIDAVYVFIDMSPLFGVEDFVETVGTPTVEAGGSITASAEGPRDYYAVVELDGTATASEDRTITVPVTMDSGTTVSVAFDVVVFAQ